MPLPVSLREVVDEMDVFGDEHHAFINKRSGELITIADEEIRLVEEGYDPKDVPAWQLDILPKVQEVLESDDYLALPNKQDIDDYRIMERFCYAVADEDHKEQLLRAISGRGAFRYFKDTLARLGLREQWYRHRDEALAEIAAGWLEEHGIPYLKKMERAP